MEVDTIIFMVTAGESKIVWFWNLKIAFKHHELYNKGLLQTNLCAPTEISGVVQNELLWWYCIKKLLLFLCNLHYQKLVISTRKE